MSSQDFGIKSAQAIRPPSVANLMIDSADRVEARFPSPWDFQFTKTNSIMNGFFTRIATTEVVLEWNDSNISGSGQLGNNSITFDLSGTGGNTFNGTETITLLEDNYTIASCLDAIVSELNDLSGTTGMGFSIITTPNIALKSTGGVFTIQASNLQAQLDFVEGPPFVSQARPLLPDLRPHRYLDFVSEDVTYCQRVKDNSTAEYPRDVLCRWYFSFDGDPQLDKYGFPILMGYTTFCTRRIYNPPKQIRWEQNIPIGNLRFQVYTDKGDLVPYYGGLSQWLMTLQISEN